MSVSLDTRTDGDTDVANTQDALRDMLVGKEELLLDCGVSTMIQRTIGGCMRTVFELEEGVALTCVCRHARLAPAHVERGDGGVGAVEDVDEEERDGACSCSAPATAA